MKKIAIIGGLSLLSVGTGSLFWNNEKLGMNPNTVAIASGGFFVAVGLTYRF